MCAKSPEGYGDRSSYATQFESSAAVREYDSLYADVGRDALIWELQRRFLASVLTRIALARGRLLALDFACGSGRILAALQPVATRLDAVDISKEMVHVAAQRYPACDVRVGDLSDPTLLPGPYDVITAFRFFLNTEPTVRVAMLQALHERLSPVGGFLIANNHGHSPSLRTLALRLSQQGGRMRNELTHDAFSSALADAGFQVVARRGYSLLPEVLHRHIGRGVARRLETSTSETKLAGLFGIDQLYVARALPREPHV